MLELGSGTVVVDGERIELPSKELRLLAELAARPGEPVASSELIASVWPESPWMTPQDLYWHISQLRRHLGGSERARRMVRNRRGIGYLLDLPPQEVILHEAIPDAEVQPETIWLDEDAATQSAARAEVVTKPPAATPQTEARRVRAPRAALTWILIAGLIAASWSGGLLLSRWRATRSLDRSDQQTVQQGTEDPEQERGQGTPTRPRQRRSGKPHRGRGRQGDRTQAPGVVAAPPTEQPSAPAPGSEPARQSRPKGPSERRDPKPQPSLPPAPTRHLYHLMDAETGDHFVTIDGGVASEYEARGYKGGAIGRIYTYHEDDTRAIATNYGTAYIFINASPKTAPGSRTTALWYSTNDSGDFFYTNSKDEATQEGWTATRIGYVRTLS